MARLTMLGPLVRTLDTSTARPLPKETDRHYGTPEHKRWAKAVADRDGNTCRDPEHEGPRVVCRGVADHITELKDGGAPFDMSNGMFRCWSCHTRKTARARAERMARRS